LLKKSAFWTWTKIKEIKRLGYSIYSEEDHQTRSGNCLHGGLGEKLQKKDTSSLFHCVTANDKDEVNKVKIKIK